jgi:hypothetical protein
MGSVAAVLTPPIDPSSSTVPGLSISGRLARTADSAGFLSALNAKAYALGVA